MDPEKSKLLLNESDDYSDRSCSSIPGTLASSVPKEMDRRKGFLQEEGVKYGALSNSVVNIALLESLLPETAPRGIKPSPLVVGSAPVSSNMTSFSSDEIAVDHCRPSRSYSHQNLLFLPEFQNQVDQLLSNVESAVARARMEVSASKSKNIPLASNETFDKTRKVAETIVVDQRRLDEAFSRLIDVAVRYDKLSESGGAVRWLHTRERRKGVLEKSIHDLLIDTNAELVSFDVGNRPANVAFESNIVTSARSYRVRARHVIPIVLLLVVWSVLGALTWHTYLGHYDWLVLLRIVRSPLLIVSYAYLIAINMKVWATLRIDYVAIFEFHADTAPTPKYAFRAAIGFTALFSGIVAAYLLLSAVVYNAEGVIVAVGVMMWALLIAFSLNPFDVFCRSGRYALIGSLGRTIFAPFFKVHFGDGWLGDQLVSLDIVFLDIEYFFCYCIYASTSGPVTAFDASVCTSNLYFIRPIITVLPTTWRFFQCLRGYMDTKNSLHLWNAGKYFTTYPVVVFATAYKPQNVTFHSLFQKFAFNDNPHLSHTIDLFNKLVSPSEVISVDAVTTSPVHQRVLSKKLEDHQFSLLLEASSPADKARLLSVSAPHAASWLLVTPSPGLDLHLDPNELQISIQWWLGIDTARGSSCSRCPGLALDRFGNHTTTCKRGGDVVTHHNHLRNVIVEFCHRAHLGVRVESGSGITPDLSRTRPADVLVLNWERGKHAALDITVTSPLIPSILTAASLSEGAAAEEAEVRKHRANDPKCSELGWVCIPLAVETYGNWGREAFSRLASHLAIITSSHKSKVLTELYSRLNFTLVRAVARALLARCAPSLGLQDIV
ncbi:hypothetical protein EMCRGX_G011492 [Ephydatia muelleri]